MVTNWYASGMDELERAVDTVVNQCLGVAAGENVLVVADTTTRRPGNIMPIHLDCVVLAPTLDVGGTRVVEAGEFILGT